MDFLNDPELEKLFKDELDERSASLAEGARAMAAGEVNAELAGRMLREGHTIKGTGRVMGYEGIAQGGETCELVWRWIQHGDLQPSSMLARTLEHLAAAIPGAITGDAHEVFVAIDTVRAIVGDPALVEQLPNPLSDESTPDEPMGEVDLRDGVGEDQAPQPDSDLSEDDDVPEDERSEDAGSIIIEADVHSLDADDVADVSATLEEIEREMERAREIAAQPEEAVAGVVAPADSLDDEGRDAEVPEDVSEGDEGSPPHLVEVAAVDVEESAPDAPAETTDDVAPMDPAVELRDEATTGSEPSGDDAIDAASAADEHTTSDPVADMSSDGPLIFEPGPDGKLPTPVITYEIVTTAFADAPAVADAASAGSGGAPSEPPSLSVVEGKSVLDPDNDAIYDLGGLLSAVDTWATEESVPVNAGRLFRLINDVAALRIDLDSAVAQSAHLLQTADSGVSAVALEGSLESLESVRRASTNLQSAALGLTAIPLEAVTATLPQLARYLSKKVDRDIDLVVEGEDTIVDRQLVDQIGEIIRQLVVNAVAHGIEPANDRIEAGKSATGMVRVVLSRDEQHVQVVVSDDGAGIDWKAVREQATDGELVGSDPSMEELRSVLYSEGFSTNPGSAVSTTTLGRKRRTLNRPWGYCFDNAARVEVVRMWMVA